MSRINDFGAYFLLMILCFSNIKATKNFAAVAIVTSSFAIWLAALRITMCDRMSTDWIVCGHNALQGYAKKCAWPFLNRGCANFSSPNYVSSFVAV